VNVLSSNILTGILISPVICGAAAPPRPCEPPLPEASRLALGQFAEA
jgi:hypothetical protein